MENPIVEAYDKGEEHDGLEEIYLEIRIEAAELGVDRDHPENAYEAWFDKRVEEEIEKLRVKTPCDT